jgi:antitoxin (DNA-binding transcriptional repressor) of toxin-antitoxin stability system
MKKNISTQNLKTHVGEVVDAVRLRGDRYIIERRDKPIAAIVPLSV